MLVIQVPLPCHVLPPGQAPLLTFLKTFCPLPTSPTSSLLLNSLAISPAHVHYFLHTGNVLKALTSLLFGHFLTLPFPSYFCPL